MEENPFPDLNISSADFLDKLEGRQKCPRCERSRKFFCYSCYVPLRGTEDKIPHVKLPVKVDIIKHPQEVAGKSTCGHAALVAPEQVTVYMYPDIPEYTDTNKVILVFPGPDALTLEEYASKFSTLNISSDGDSSAEKVHSDQLTEDVKHSGTCLSSESSCATSAATCQALLNSADGSTDADGRKPGEKQKKQYKKTFDRVVFIDSTWHQVSRIRLDKRLLGLQKVEIKKHTTMFWRHQQNKPESYLSTIEAIYYFMREYHDLFEVTPYTGQYDNLLFLFKFMYRKIRFEYEKGKVLKAYENRNK